MWLDAAESICHTIESEIIFLPGYVAIRAVEIALGRAAANDSCIILWILLRSSNDGV